MGSIESLTLSLLFSPFSLLFSRFLSFFSLFLFLVIVNILWDMKRESFPSTFSKLSRMSLALVHLFKWRHTPGATICISRKTHSLNSKDNFYYRVKQSLLFSVRRVKLTSFLDFSFSFVFFKVPFWGALLWFTANRLVAISKKRRHLFTFAVKVSQRGSKIFS